MKIFTLTLNPAFDVHAQAASFAIHRESVASVTSRDAGGKGINISRALSAFGVENEAFVLLEGSAVLYARNDDGEVEKLEMQPCTVYNIPKDIWHHIIVADENTTVLVVENSNTSKSNTERILP